MRQHYAFSKSQSKFQIIISKKQLWSKNRCRDHPTSSTSSMAVDKYVIISKISGKPLYKDLNPGFLFG
jgi:hypothetical protein